MRIAIVRIVQAVGVLAATVTLAIVGNGIAAGPQVNPCADDVKKLCAGVEPGGGKILACLRQHEAQLSPQCQAFQKAERAKVEDVAEACKTDTAKFCKGVPPGAGRILTCLKQHQADLSSTCKSEIQGPKKAM